MSQKTSKVGPRAHLRGRSKKLFGNADRLEVAAAVAESSGLVHAQELSESLSISPPRVRTQLLAFVDAGLMRALPRNGHTQDYERLDDPFWRWVATLIEAWVPEGKRNLRSGRPAASDSPTEARH